MGDLLIDAHTGGNVVARAESVHGMGGGHCGGPMRAIQMKQAQTGRGGSLKKVLACAALVHMQLSSWGGQDAAQRQPHSDGGAPSGSCAGGLPACECTAQHLGGARAVGGGQR
jgi:hypothetical protein